MRVFVLDKAKRFFPYILCLLFCGIVVLWLSARPAELELDLTAEQVCFLKMYHSKHPPEGRPVKMTVTPANSKYIFSLPGKTRRICLEFSGIQPGERVTIKNLSLIRNWIFTRKAANPDNHILLPSRDIVFEGNGCFKVTGPKPRLYILPSFKDRVLNIRRGSLVLLVLVLGCLVLSQIGLDEWNRLETHFVRLPERLHSSCSANSCFLIYAAVVLLLVFGYELFQLPISADDDWYVMHEFERYENCMPASYSLTAAFSDRKSVPVSYASLKDNYIAHGRWPTVLLLYIFPVFSPVLSLFFTLLCMTLAFLLLAEKMSLPPVARYIFYPLFICHPVFYEYYMFFMAGNTYGINYLLMFISSVFVLECRDKRLTALLIFGALFFTASLQSLVFLLPLWFLLNKMSELHDDRLDYKRAAFDLLKLSGICILVLLGYFLALKYSLWVFETQWEYLGDCLQKPESLKEALRSGLELLRVLSSIYTGKFEFAVHGQLLLILLMSAAILIRLFRKKRHFFDIVLMTAALAGILLLPSALHIVLFNAYIPIRSMVSYPLMMTGLCILGWRALEDCPKLRIIAGLLIVFVSIQYAILVNQKAYATKFRYDQDRSLLQSVKDRFYQIPEFTSSLNDKKKIPLAVVGKLPFPGYRSFPMWNDSMLNWAFEPATVINLHILGETYFYPASDSEIKRILPVAMSMPYWPASGSVRYQDGIMIVKFSEFSPYQCQQFDLPFITDALDIPFFRLKKLPARGKPFWVLNKETLDSAASCTVDFTGSGIRVRPAATGWPKMSTEALHADPRKMYCLQLDPKTVKGHGYLYLHFKNPNKSGEEIITSIEIHPGDANCVTAIPGRYLEGPVWFSLGDFPGKEYFFEKIALFELDSWEDILKDDIMKYKKQPEKNHPN